MIAGRMILGALVAAVCAAIAHAEPPEAAGFVSLHHTRVVLTAGAERHAAPTKEYRVTFAVFELGFSRGLLLDRMQEEGRRWIRTPVELTDARLAERSLAGLFSLRCGERRIDASALRLAEVYDHPPLLPLRWTLIPLHANTSDKLESVMEYSTRAVAAPAEASRGAGSVLRFGLLLHYEDSLSTSVLETTLLAGDGGGDRFEALRARLPACALTLIPAGEQLAWPIGRLVTERGRPLQGVLADRFEMLADTPIAPVRSTTMLKVERLQHSFESGQDRTRANAALWRYPSVAARWKSPVPPMPHYCGLHEGNLTRAQVQALQARHESVFLESAMHSIPGLSSILEACMKMAMPPLMDPFMEQIKDKFGNAGAKATAANSVEIVPKAVVQTTAPKVATDVSNALTDSVPPQLARRIASGLVMDLGIMVSKAVAAKITPILHDDVIGALTVALPHRIKPALINMMHRALPIRLLTRLTKSVTHALVPTLTIALTQNSHQHIWCHFCYYYHQHCQYCHDSPQSQYYTSFYSTYYCDYYSDYYAAYYQEALEKVERKVWAGK